MLVALTNKQQLFQLSTKLSREELQLLKQHHQFFCPQCNEQLLLKVGQIKIPHFAHQKNSDCLTLFSEGESTAHLLGKQDLYQLFTKLQLNPILEPYLRHLQQRPDLFISKNGRQYAIEFQCSPISYEVFRQRTNGYLNASIIPIWVLHTTEKFKMPGIVKVSINYTHGQFIQRYKNQRYLLTYDVKSKTFYYLSNLIHIHNRQYLAYVKTLPLYRQHFPFLIPEKISLEKFQLLFTNFQKYRDHYLRTRLLFSKKGVNDRFLRAIYELQLSITHLPNFLGIPTNYTTAFDIFCVEWQVQLFYFMKSHALTPNTMNIRSIPYFFEWIHMELTDERKRAVEHYIKILQRLQIGDVQQNIDRNHLFRALHDELVAIG